MRTSMLKYSIIKAHKEIQFDVTEDTSEDEVNILLDLVDKVKRKYPELELTTKVVDYELQPAVLTVKIYD